MNFIKELNAFRDWVTIHPMPSGSVVLWYTLMNINNSIGWKQQFNAANSTVQVLSGLSKTGVEKARRNLLEKKLIHFEKGSRGRAPIYEMCSLSNWRIDQTNHHQPMNEKPPFHLNQKEELPLPKDQLNNACLPGNQMKENEQIHSNLEQNQLIGNIQEVLIEGAKETHKEGLNRGESLKEHVKDSQYKAQKWPYLNRNRNKKEEDVRRKFYFYFINKISEI